jgi:hypothetical protein
MFHILAEDLAFCFPIFTLTISYRAFMCIPLLPRSNYCPDFHAPMPFVVDVLSFLVLGAILSCPFFCSPCFFCWAIPVQRVILLPAAANSFRGPPFPWVRISLTKVPLRRASPAWRVIVLLAAVTSSRGLQFPWVRYP